MASQRPAASAGGDQQPHATLHITSLHPDLLVDAFRHVPLVERHTALALVCKQWAELVHSPPLLTSLEVSIIEGSDGLPHLRSLEAWLARRAAGHVRQLQLKAVLLLDDHMEHATEAAAALSSALAPLASSLCDLSLVTSDLPLPPLDSWLAPLVGLTSLSLTTDYTNVSIAGPLGCLSALQRLRLSIVDGDVSLAPEASLPPALTHLWFGTVDSPLPSQVGGLRHLQELAVVRTTTTAEQYAPLARLHSSLTALSITDGDHMPGCLAQLTALRSLTIHRDGGLSEGGGESLAAALPRLQQLTAVHLYATCLPSSPTALSSLQHLHTVSWLGAIDGPRPLPGGPWLAGLRRLVLSSCILSSAASLTTLSSAQQLERLGVFDTHVGVPIYGRKVLRRVLHILQWAQQHTSLQLLALDSTLRGAAAAAATAAMQQRPGLQIKPAADVDVVVCDYLQDSVHDQIY